ncbi:exo-alpha-sialidase [Edwardsiella piscicida]|uniref:exo-alpha-sialidase n=1 Tax=Edwardsiella piscicida TaxID=1263550 RepID=UPI00247A84FE|nr:exo-alpha-sialidase [Edwardsiella piscicida]WGS78210.1 exo-alpha-sialidase [Edwardsiella piscicida]WGS81597.1 exo-alpha-sialidase [Edwardsiella piscicida]
MNNNLLLLTAGCLLSLSSGVRAVSVMESGVPHDGWHAPMLIFAEHDRTANNGWRIPAITVTQGGALIAVSDARAVGTSDIGQNQDVHFGYRISYDRGDTWGEIHDIAPSFNGKRQISDPAIVYNPDSGSTFLFGYYNDRFITSKPLSRVSDFFMFTSDDGGKTWDRGTSLYDLAPTGYKYILQGPGSGMYHDGTLYLAAQAWHHDRDSSLVGSGATVTSGYLYSSDNGVTWNSAWLRPDDKIVGAPGTGVDDLPDITSESSVFHHDGHIYLAAKSETSRESKSRVVYRTKDNGQRWERVEEAFLPENISRAETSSLSLDDSVYLVGYSTATERANRDGIYITTNTGRTIQVYDSPSYGYTSMTKDEDNLYILFEGEGDIYLQRYDIAARDYANISATILNRSNDLFDIATKLRTASSYIKGGYGSHASSDAEFVYADDWGKLGVFFARQSENSQRVPGTIQYTNSDVSLTLAKDDILFSGDNVFVGYQHSDIQYDNDAANKVKSVLAGYSYQHDFGVLSYHLMVNTIYGENRFSRNRREGLGRKADFNAYSVAIKNMLAKDIYLADGFYAGVASGLHSTFFSHSAIQERGGNGWNNASVDSADHASNQLLLDGQLSKRLHIMQSNALTLTAKASYQYELMDTAKWAEAYRVLDARRLMPTPVKRYPHGLATGYLEAALSLHPQAVIAAGASLNTDGDGLVAGSFTYTF